MASSSTLPDSHFDGSVDIRDEPPPYERGPFQVPMDNRFIEQNAAVGAEDGRIDLDFDSKIGRALASIVPHPPPYLPSYSYLERRDWHIKLNIVIQVVGSRGDVQPFIALGNELQKHGHRVRLATHNIFEDFVRTSGLEFYPIGGDPAQLMAYMVKNPGLIPSMKSLRRGDIQHKRAMVLEMLEGCWRSCVEPDIVSHSPFVADAIIANPPSFAHVHCAQALNIPVHLMFTMPWTSTRAFAHPLANLKNSNTDPGMANYISYGVVEFLTWHALGDLINKWRHSLDLEPVPISEGPGLVDTLKIPFTYCWSPALVPKPADWASHIDVCGFFFRGLPNYTPPADLDAFLRAGPPPVYIGFGSVVMDDPDRMIDVILQAARAAGVRVIISSGWSKLDGPPSPDVLFLGECPHEWLFQHVAAVVHHGGAGTTACGLLNGRPTITVPFFGDQPFWGHMVAAAGAGPKPIHHKDLDVKRLADAIAFCLTPEAAAAAMTIGTKMRSESGVKEAVASFHARLPLARLQCDILPDRPAAWSVKNGRGKIRLSKLAAQVLAQNSDFDRKALKPHATQRISIENRRWDPVTGLTSASIATATNMFVNPYRAFRDSNYNIASSPTSLTPRYRVDNDVKRDRSSLYPVEKDEKEESSSLNPPSRTRLKKISKGKAPTSPTSSYPVSKNDGPISHPADQDDQREGSTSHLPPSCTLLRNPTKGRDSASATSSYPVAKNEKGDGPISHLVDQGDQREGSNSHLPPSRTLLRKPTKGRDPASTTSYPVEKEGKEKGFIPYSAEKDEDDKGEGSSRGIVATRRKSTAGAIAAASGRSVGAFVTSFSKGAFVDMPLAAIEGARAMPKLYGEEVKDRDQIRDWKSGLVVAGKNFVQAFPSGLADTVVQPYKGIKEDGAIGLVKGIAKGSLGLATKTTTSVLGLGFYPVQGIYKSVYAAMNDRTRREIIKAKHEEGQWLLKLDHGLLPERVVAVYDELLRGKGKSPAIPPPKEGIYDTRHKS
ncbi:hypothetical protein B0H19DRAFT_1069079 [Mycena capillaripes]|nr:hypothetical protein B0H19DRAFT_1069079 [Mycena capillaripes]